MGVLAALVTAMGWAVSGTMVAARLKQVDPITQSAVRASCAWLFVVAALFVLGAQGDVWHMPLGDLWQIIAIGLLGLAVGDVLYMFLIGLLGMTRAFTTVIGIYSLMAFVLPAIFLGDAVSWDQAVGAGLVVIGVCLVALYGRPRHSPAAGRSGRRRLLRRSAKPAGEHPLIGGGSQVKAAIALAAPAVRMPLAAPTTSRLLLGTLVALGTGLSWAASGTWLRSVAGSYDAAAIATVEMPVAGLVLLVLAVLLRGRSIRRRSLGPRAVMLIGLSGVLSLGIGSILFVYAVQQIGTGPASVLFATAPIFALPLGIIFLHERITRWGVGGAGIAVAGIALLA